MKPLIAGLLLLKLFLLSNQFSESKCAQPIRTKLDYVTKYEISGNEWINWMRTEFSFVVYFKPVTLTKVIGFIKDVNTQRTNLPTTNLVIEILQNAFKLAPIDDITMSNSYPSPWTVDDVNDLSFEYCGLNIFHINIDVFNGVRAKGGAWIAPMYGHMFDMHNSTLCGNNITITDETDVFVEREDFKTAPCQKFGIINDSKKVSFKLEVESKMFKDDLALKSRDINATQFATNTAIKISRITIDFKDLIPLETVKEKLYSDIITPLSDEMFDVISMLPFKPDHDLKYRIRISGNINEEEVEHRCDFLFNIREVGDPHNLFAHITSNTPCAWPKIQRSEKFSEMLDTVSLLGIYAAGVPNYHPLNASWKHYNLLCVSEFCGIPNSFFIETVALLKFRKFQLSDTIENSESQRGSCKAYHRFNNSTLTSTSTQTCNCSHGYLYKEKTEQRLNLDTYTFAWRRTTVELDFGAKLTPEAAANMTDTEKMCREMLLKDIVSSRDDHYLLSLSRTGKLYGQMEVVFDRNVRKEVNDRNGVFNYFGEPVNEKTLKLT